MLSGKTETRGCTERWLVRFNAFNRTRRAAFYLASVDDGGPVNVVSLDLIPIWTEQS